MAFGNKPSAQLTYGLVDETGSRSSIQFDVPYGTLTSVVITAAGVLRPLIMALTGCAVVSQSLTYSETDNAPFSADAGSRVENKGLVQFYTLVGKTVGYQIPGILPSLVKKSGALNEDMPALQAFVNALVAVDAVFCDSNGVSLSAYRSGYQRSRSSTRAMNPTERRPDADIIP